MNILYAFIGLAVGIINALAFWVSIDNMNWAGIANGVLALFWTIVAAIYFAKD